MASNAYEEAVGRLSDADLQALREQLVQKQNQLTRRRIELENLESPDAAETLADMLAGGGPEGSYQSRYDAVRDDQYTISASDSETTLVLAIVNKEIAKRVSTNPETAPETAVVVSPRGDDVGDGPEFAAPQDDAVDVLTRDPEVEVSTDVFTTPSTSSDSIVTLDTGDVTTPGATPAEAAVNTDATAGTKVGPGPAYPDYASETTATISPSRAGSEQEGEGVPLDFGKVETTYSPINSSPNVSTGSGQTRWWPVALGVAVLIIAAIIGIAVGTSGSSAPSLASHGSATTGGSSLKAPTPLTPTGSSGSPGVIIATNQLSFSGDVCHGGGTLALVLKIEGIAPGTPVQLTLSGPGVPPTVTLQANPGQQTGETFAIQGAGVWGDNIVSIGGRTPPSDGAHVQGPVQC